MFHIYNVWKSSLTWQVIPLAAQVNRQPKFGFRRDVGRFASAAVGRFAANSGRSLDRESAATNGRYRERYSSSCNHDIAVLGWSWRLVDWNPHYTTEGW